jgi:hypothetical protein
MEYFSYLISLITDDARCKRDTKSRFSLAKVVFTNKLDLNLKNRLVQRYIWRLWAQLCMVLKPYKASESRSEIPEKFWNVVLGKDGDSWIDHIRNEEILHTIKKGKNILRTIKRRKANWIDHTLRRNFLLQHVIGGKIEGWKWEEQEEDVRSHRMIFKETRGYWRLKGAALDCPLWRTSFGRGYRPFLRQTTEWRYYLALQSYNQLLKKDWSMKSLTLNFQKFSMKVLPLRKIVRS